MTRISVIVCGTRDYPRSGKLAVLGALEEVTHSSGLAAHKAVTVITGGCRGPDEWGAYYAPQVGATSAVYHADWGAYGKAAGPLRNKRMLEEGKPKLVLAFWDGKSRGTLDMITRAAQAGVLVRIYPPNR